MIRNLTERYLKIDYNYVFPLNIVIIVNFKRSHGIRKEV